jgi:predicted nucleic acid-binding Zn ribbon protein
MCECANEKSPICASGHLSIISYLRAKSVTKMERQRKKSTGLYWFLFLASTAALIFAIAVHFEYLTLILPFQVTFFAKALDIM